MPSAVPIADVLSIYLDDCAPPEPDAFRRFSGRIGRLLDFWGARALDEIDAASCRAYVDSRGSAGGARRDLEDLRSAVNHHARQRLHHGVVIVDLPDKGPARDRWLTRSEAAQLLWTCWRTRELQSVRHDGTGEGPKAPTSKYPLRHLARFILVGLYTGSRSGAIAAASWYAAAGKSYLDLEAGLFYRHRAGARRTNKRQPPSPFGRPLPPSGNRMLLSERSVSSRRSLQMPFSLPHSGILAISSGRANGKAFPRSLNSPGETTTTTGIWNIARRFFPTLQMKLNWPLGVRKTNCRCNNKPICVPL